MWHPYDFLSGCLYLMLYSLRTAIVNLMAVLRFEHLCPVFTLLYRQYFYGIAAISDQAARFMFFAACSQTNYLLC